MGSDKLVCPYCRGQRVWLKGRVPSRTGPKQRYVCFDCGRSFYKEAVKSTPEKKATGKKRGRPRKSK